MMIMMMTMTMMMIVMMMMMMMMIVMMMMIMIKNILFMISEMSRVYIGVLQERHVIWPLFINRLSVFGKLAVAHHAWHSSKCAKSTFNQFHKVNHWHKFICSW